MKNLFILAGLISFCIAGAQPIVQPLASGDYWRIEEYNQKLREFANTRTLDPTARLNFPSGSVGIADIRATRLTGVNEINWVASTGTNVSMFYVEYSRNNHDWERAGQVTLFRTEDGNRYVFRHPFNDNNLVYYRIAVVNKNNSVVAYSPAVQLADEEFSTKIFPTVVRGKIFHVQAGEPYESLQVTSSDGKLVFVKPLDGATGTLTIGLPNLAPGVYFARLTSSKRPQFVQKIFVE
jgi:hypothetical protein